jgi:exonuclease SbcC
VRAKELEERLRELGEITTLHTRRCAELGTAIAGKREQQLEARNAISKLESEADELGAIIAERSGGRTPETVERDLERMRESDRTAQHVRDVITNEQQKLGVMRSELATLEASVAEQSNRHAAAESLVCRITSEVAARRGEIARTIDAIRGDGEAEHALTALVEARTSRREQLAREKRESEAQLNQATGDLMVRSAAIEHTRTARDRDEADRKGAEERCATALASAGFAHADEARAACLEPSEQRVLRERIRSIDESLRLLATRLDENTRRVAGRTIDEAELAALREAHADARRVQDEAIGAAAAARRELDRVRAQNVEYHRFQKENAGALERERTVEQLGRFMQGDAFINFLADERLADVCRRASRTLEDLTGGRYAIVSRPDEGFIVRDLANGGIERSPASLSGGETFVVSLSLALALSDTIQLGRAPLEFFFLDEGFGTLDAELLDTVIDTLERLRSRRRTIGLITHVGALRERIPRRLVVTPPSDVHGSIVRYEVA